MTRPEPTADAPTGSAPTGRPGFLVQLGVEVAIGLVLAILLVVVGWASSNAIRFVYGGY